MKWDDSLADEWDDVGELPDALPDDESVVIECLPNGIALREDDDEDVYIYARDEDLVHDSDADVDHRRRERR